MLEAWIGDVMMKQAMCYRGKCIAITYGGHTGKITIDEDEFPVKMIRFEHRLWACDRLYVMWPTLEQLARDLVDHLCAATAQWYPPPEPMAASNPSQVPPEQDEERKIPERVSPA